MPKLVIRPDDFPYSDHIAKWGVGQLVNLLTTSGIGSAALAVRFLTVHSFEETGFYRGMYGPEYSRGSGGPSALTQPPPSSSKDSPQARASAQGGKAGAPARASQRGSRPGRESCPKGHYWSFKHKKCVKSKFKSR